MTFLAFTRHPAWQYLAEVHPQLTEKKSPGRVKSFRMSASGYKRTCGGVSDYVCLYGPVAVKVVLVGCALPVFLFFGSRVVSGSCDGIHVSCEDRINLYPAAPIRLATMLNAWTIAEVGWG